MGQIGPNNKGEMMEIYRLVDSNNVVVTPKGYGDIFNENTTPFWEDGAPNMGVTYLTGKEEAVINFVMKSVENHLKKMKLEERKKLDWTSPILRRTTLKDAVKGF